MEERQPKLLIVTTSPLALHTFFQTQLTQLAAFGLEVHAVSTPGRLLDACRAERRVTVHAVRMSRDIDPIADALSLIRLLALLRQLRPDILHTHTPKAGLLGMMAAKLTGVPVRIYTINGLVSSTRTGWRRRVLDQTERIACRLASDVLCVSHSLRQEVIRKGLCAPRKIRTLGEGSSHGVNLQRFRPSGDPTACRAQVRRAYRIPEESLVLGFVGRIVRDKGIEELAIAWGQLRSEFSSLRLLICGEPEPHDPVSPHVLHTLRSDDRVHMTPKFVDDMPSVYSALDIVVLPTYREGLPNVVLECAAMEVPIVATSVSGCIDVVKEGLTGLLVPPRNAEALANALRRLLQDPNMRRNMGKCGREFVAARFSEDRVCRLLIAEYWRLLIRSCGN
jgi:glycosyltransferase involved in cell wall biosynthesis